MCVSYRLVVHLVVVDIEVLVELSDNLFWTWFVSVFRIESYEKVIASLLDFDSLLKMYMMETSLAI